MIYLFENPGVIPKELLARMLSVLPPERKEKALKFRHAIDQKQSATGYLLLTLALRDEYGIREHPLLSYGKNGKPWLATYPHIHFNISHCKRAVACAVSTANVGIDVECVDFFETSLAERICDGQELAVIMAADRPDIAFTKLWTAKESVLKFTGEGLRDDIREILTDMEGHCHFRTIETGDGLYALTVCHPPGMNAESKVRYLALSDLIRIVDEMVENNP